MLREHFSIPRVIRTILPPLGLVLASLLLTIVAVELVIFYLLDIKPLGYGYRRFFEFSADTGHFHVPGARGYWYRYYDGSKYWVSINRHGFADSERELAKKRPRIALIGDSVTEFWEAAPEDRGQIVIEQMLNGRYEVLNFGVRGFGTDQTFLLFQRKGLAYDPDIVIYTFGINDPYDNAKTRNKPYFRFDPQQPGQIVLHGHPVQKPSGAPHPPHRLGQALDAWLTNGYIYRHLRKKFKRWRKQWPTLTEQFEMRPYKKQYNAEDELRMAITLEIVSAMNRFLKEKGIRFLVVEGVFKYSVDAAGKAEMIRRYGEIFDFDRVTGTLQRFCNRERIPFLSLQQIVKARKIPIHNLMHKEDRMHFNAAGIRFYAAEVTDKLRDLGWLSEDNGD